MRASRGAARRMANSLAAAAPQRRGRDGGGGDYDYVIVNETDHPDDAVEQIWEIIQAEARRDPPRRSASDGGRPVGRQRSRPRRGRRARRPPGAHLHLPPAGSAAAMRRSPDRWCWCPTGIGWRSDTCCPARRRARSGIRSCATSRRSVSAPMLTPDLLALAEEIAAYYRAPLGTTIAAMLPPGLESRLDRRWQLGSDAAAARWAGRACRPRRGRDRYGPHAAGAETRSRAVAGTPAPQRRGSCRAGSFDRRKSPRAACACCVASRTDRLPARAPRSSRRCWRRWRTASERCPSWRRSSGSTPASLLAPARRLVAIGAAELDWRDVERDPLAHRPTAGSTRPMTWRTSSRPRWRRSRRCRRAASCCWRASRRRARRTSTWRPSTRPCSVARRAIVLVPEVSLIPQLADRLHGAGRRRRWRCCTPACRRASATTSGGGSSAARRAWWSAPGRRSSRRSPVRCCIVVDEAHDAGFKSDRTPRYDARWVARRRAALSGGRLVLGTATPDVVTLARVRGGLVERSVLHERRVGQAPRIELVDMRDELAEGNRSIFSRLLHAALRDLRPGTEQAILLMNRRGASTFVLCRDCGESLRCPDCDLPFVYHSAGEQLRCHHCGRTAPPPETLPALRLQPDPLLRRRHAAGRGRAAQHRSRTCGSPAWTRTRWPRGAASRRSTTTCATAASTSWSARSSRPRASTCRRVTLAAVIAADVTLNLPDYLAPERTFQLLAQVAGRAGRGPMPGRVLIQTYAADHYAIRAAARAGRRWLRRRGAAAAQAARLSAGQRPGAAAGRRPGPRPRRGARSEPRPKRCACPASRSTGRCRPTSPAAPVAGDSRSCCARSDAAATVRGARAGAGRRGDRRRPGVAALVASLDRYNAGMVIRRILTADEPILRERAKKVTQFDASLHRLLDDMLETMRDAPGHRPGRQPDRRPAAGRGDRARGQDHRADQPAARQAPAARSMDWEGCLSIPGFVAEVKRSRQGDRQGQGSPRQGVPGQGRGALRAGAPARDRPPQRRPLHRLPRFARGAGARQRRPRRWRKTTTAGI